MTHIFIYDIFTIYLTLNVGDYVDCSNIHLFIKNNNNNDCYENTVTQEILHTPHELNKIYEMIGDCLIKKNNHTISYYITYDNVNLNFNIANETYFEINLHKNNTAKINQITNDILCVELNSLKNEINLLKNEIKFLINEKTHKKRKIIH